MKLLLIHNVVIPNTSKVDKVMYWAKRNIANGAISLPGLLDQNAEKIRNEYISWCDNLCEIKIRDVKVFDRFKLDNNFSFWSLSLIAEKSPQKSPEIYTIFKLRALELYVINNKINEVELITNDRKLIKLIKYFSFNMGINFSSSFYKKNSSIEFKSKNKSFMRKFYDITPHFFQAVIYFIFEIVKYFLYFSKKKKFFQVEKQITMVTYFPNIDKDFANQGIYQSLYWGDIKKLIDKDNFVNWVWIYNKNNQFNIKKSSLLREKFIKCDGKNKKYFFIEEFMNISSFFRVLRIYFFVYLKSLFFRKIRYAFKFKDSKFNFYHLLHNDWRKSLNGYIAMQNAFKFLQFTNMVKLLPKQNLCLYIWENQAWEKNLIQCWKTYQKTLIYGYQHASMAFHDTRHLMDTNNFLSSVFPDRVLINGKASYHLLGKELYSKYNASIVEAVRFHYILKLKHLQMDSKYLLILTGYDLEIVEQQLQLLNQVIMRNPNLIRNNIIIKPHPYQSIQKVLARYEYLKNIKIENGNLTDLLLNAEVVYCDNHTTAAIEAAYFGKPLILHLPEDGFNMSPLFNPIENEEINFVTSVEQLTIALHKKKKIENFNVDFFCLDNSLGKWEKLIGNSI